MARSRASRKEMAKAIMEFYERHHWDANIELHAKGCSYGEPDYTLYEIGTLCICGLLPKEIGQTWNR